MRIPAVVLTGVLMVSCASPPEARVPPVWIDWAQTDDERAAETASMGTPNATSPDCKMTPRPDEIWITPSHTHKVSIGCNESGTKFVARASGDDIVEVNRVPQESQVFELRGKALGLTHLEFDSDDYTKSVSLRVRGVSHRVTVVGWVNGDAIDPDVLAPKRSDTVQRAFANDSATRRQLFKLFISSLPAELGVPPPRPSFLTSEPDDRLYAEAVLIKRSANSEPPRELSQVLRDRDYRLLVDFRVAGGTSSPFSSFPHEMADIGKTPLPFQMDAVTSDPVISRMMDALQSPEVGKANGTMRCPCTSAVVELLGEGRVGGFGQLLHQVLTDPKKPTGDATPWIWAAVAFDGRGEYMIKTQIFPTYTVYVDGVRQDDLTKMQANLADFLKLDHNSHFSSGFASGEGVKEREEACKCGD